MRTIILNSISTELVRSSYYFYPYFLASVEKDALLVEDASVEMLGDMGLLDEEANWVISFWSYPQIDFIEWALFTLRGTFRFIGYRPFIEKVQGEVYEFDIAEGLRLYPKNMRKFVRIWYDADMHIKGYGDRIVWPMFLSFGCPYDRSFCWVRRSELDFGMITMPIKDAEESLFVFGREGNFHFLDENFFIKKPSYLDRLYEMMDGSFNWLALSSAKNLRKEIERVGVDFLQRKGLGLVEVDFEGADPFVRSDMKKKDSMSDIQFLADSELNIFWLTITFYPGDNIESIRRTGAFLREYGFPHEKMLSRINTNSTVGGLGQFYRPYIRTQISSNAGVFTTRSPTRLVPSFLPDSFLNEIPVALISDFNTDELGYWLNVYNCQNYGNIFNGIDSIRKLIYDNPLKMSVYIALCARFGYIESRGTKREEIEYACW